MTGRSGTNTEVTGHRHEYQQAMAATLDDPEFQARFWSRIDKNGPVPPQRPDLGPCWLTTLRPNQHGYGQARSA